MSRSPQRRSRHGARSGTRIAVQPEIRWAVAVAIGNPCPMEEVRRPEDGELCGFVDARDGVWCALVVFGEELGRHTTRADAEAQVRCEGLSSLAERWTLRQGDGTEQIVCVQEANPESVTVALGYYSLPGVPTLTLDASGLVSGDWSMRRERAGHGVDLPVGECCE